MDVKRRHELGQWYTPPAVADLALALALPRGRRDTRVLDPTCGDGVFLARARALGVAAQGLYGIELDHGSARAAEKNVPGATIWRRDLFADDASAPCSDFDAVVGNPPYVRQERLTRAQKLQTRNRLARDWPHASPADLDRLLGRGDLAAACILRALRFARAGARVALVVSSALLDAGYADAFWRVLDGCGRVVAIVDAPEERWFADAAVNALILVIERRARSGGSRVADSPVCVARLSVATSIAAKRFPRLDTLDSVADVRRAPADRADRWAVYLRAPEVWFDFERRARGALVPLVELAEVWRGMTTGANDVFYLRREQAVAQKLEAAVLMPLLRTPRDEGKIAIDPIASSHVALVCPPEDEKLSDYPNARRYLQAHREVAERPTLRTRDPWWALPVRPARLFLTKAYAARFVQRLARAPMAADQRVYTIHPRPNSHVAVLAGVLNSTFTALALESLGRSSMGEGALEWTVADTARLPVLDPRRLDSRQRRAVCDALAELSLRAIDTVDRERTMSDRRRLDRAVARAGPAGLADLIEPAGSALVQSVETRSNRKSRPLV